ncbi:hypothetical protein Tco_0286168 [Tanacetum coccineum]
METHKPLPKDADGEDVDEHMYRSMIGSLMYLTSSRLDIMFVVCQPKLGIWYPKDSPFDLVAYTDSDYARTSLDRKSTTRGCQFLGCRLISWQCKKQTVVTNSTTEAEYVVPLSCCGQVIWIQNKLLDYRDSNEKKLIQMIKIHIDKNIADLLTKAFDKGIGVNAGDLKLMLLGINLLLLEKVNAARHNLLLLVSIRMEQYLINIDYGLWKVIMNGDEPVQTTKDKNGVETEVPLKTAQALLQRQKERKAESSLLLAIPDEYQLRFHEGLDKAYNRFQKLISQLEIHGAAISNEDANQKFLRALPLSWNNIALIMRNKEGIDELDIYDLYNNLKVFKVDIKGSSRSSLNSQNVAFLSAEDTNSINEVNTTIGVSTAAGYSSQGQASSSSYTNDLMFSFFADQSSGLQIDDEDLEQPDQDN